MKHYETPMSPYQPDSYENVSVPMNTSINPARAIKELRETLAIAQVVASHRKAGLVSAAEIISRVTVMLNEMEGHR